MKYTKGNWSTTQTSEIFDGLIPGKYNFIIRDSITKCEAKYEVVIRTVTNLLGIIANPRNVTCFGGSDGSISVNVDETNDNPQYTYSLSRGGITPIVDQISSEFGNLKAGTYGITVKSGKGCLSTLEDIVVGQSPLILIKKTTVTQYTCLSDINRTNNATISIDDIEGGSGNYVTYQFLRDGIEVQNKASNIYKETDHFGGSYIVNVYDHTNCVGTLWPLVINPFATLHDISFTKVLPISCSSGESIKVNVAVTGTVAPSLKFILTGIDKTVICSQTNNTGEFSGLGIGDYLITVINTDSGCEISDYYHVLDPHTFEIKVNEIKTNICYGTYDGVVELTLIDRQAVRINEAGAFNYTITGPLPTIKGKTYNSGPLKITGLIAGEYKVVAKLINDPECEVVTSFHISQPQTALGY